MSCQLPIFLAMDPPVSGLSGDPCWRSTLISSSWVSSTLLEWLQRMPCPVWFETFSLVTVFVSLVPRIVSRLYTWSLCLYLLMRIIFFSISTIDFRSVSV